MDGDGSVMGHKGRSFPRRRKAKSGQEIVGRQDVGAFRLSWREKTLLHGRRRSWLRLLHGSEEDNERKAAAEEGRSPDDGHLSNGARGAKRPNFLRPLQPPEVPSCRTLCPAAGTLED